MNANTVVKLLICHINVSSVIKCIVENTYYQKIIIAMVMVLITENLYLGVMRI